MNDMSAFLSRAFLLVLHFILVLGLIDTRTARKAPPAPPSSLALAEQRETATSTRTRDPIHACFDLLGLEVSEWLVELFG